MANYMKSICTLFFAALLCIGTGSPLYASDQTSDFLSVLPDIPLPIQVTETLDSQMDFDSANGRIIQVAASGPVSMKEIIKFYQNTLPQLGWVVKSDQIFLRENEQLKLSFSSENNLTILQFELSPHNK